MVCRVSQAKGTILYVDVNGTLVDVKAKSSVLLLIWEACINGIKHVKVGIVPGLSKEFVMINENQHEDNLILTLCQIQ